MTGWRWLGLLLIALGIALLLVAPQAQSCVTAFDHTSCRATGTILLKVVGLALVVAAAAVLALRGTATDQ
jgi:drug/metabolite transporter (DMT)-like permease